MDLKGFDLLKFISIIQRNTRRYFDLMLEGDGIGSGQQFFLLWIYENSGITMHELSRSGSFDKATATKAVQKLAEEGYVTVTVDVPTRMNERQKEALRKYAEEMGEGDVKERGKGFWGKKR